MTSILKQLCDAPIGLNSKPCAPGPCYAKTVKARHELLETLKSDLDKHQNELLESFLGANDEVTDMLIMEKFSHGFSLGALLTQELGEGGVVGMRFGAL